MIDGEEREGGGGEREVEGGGGEEGRAVQMGWMGEVGRGLSEEWKGESGGSGGTRRTMVDVSDIVNDMKSGRELRRMQRRKSGKKDCSNYYLYRPTDKLTDRQTDKSTLTHRWTHEHIFT